ncbi:unnamed protein product, partial [marine sediment metagenome]
EIINIGKRFGFSDGFLLGGVVATLISNAIWVIVYNFG